MCQSLIGLARTDDVIWVHDYHLMMLPKLIKDAALKVSIVFYMHVPFPTSQIFRFGNIVPYSRHLRSYSYYFPTPHYPIHALYSLLTPYSHALITTILISYIPYYITIRSLPAANELLQSMTCADVVGFHAFDHARYNFVTPYAYAYSSNPRL